jgi:recombinational DNA repair protein RecR
MDIDTNSDQYKEIEKLIASDESVVGIDAKKTHLIIIHLLKEIQNQVNILDKRLTELENRL